MKVEIISGGQTGVDQGALDAALDLGASCSGWSPDGHYDENGALDAKYPLTPMSKGNGYVERTRANVARADATVIIYYSDLEGGTKLTLQYCFEEKKRFKLFDADTVTPELAAEALVRFAKKHKLKSLNVAGPRGSKQPHAHDYTYACVKSFLKNL